MRTGILVLSMVMLVSGFALAAEDQRVDVTNFEPESDWDIQVTGNTIVESWVDDPSIDNVPKHEGDMGLYGMYYANDAYHQTTLDLPETDLTGMTELHFWIYFFEGSQPHQNGNFTMRVYLPGGAVAAEPALTGTGEWHHVVLPIDRATSQNALSDFSQLKIIWMPGANNEAEGRFYIDEIYGFRPANAPTVKDVLVYGFNETNADNEYPKGWTIRADEAIEGGLMMGDAIVEPSEGSDYLESWLPGGWMRPFETINALDDFDEWEKVVDIKVDVRMSEDFSSWHNFVLVTDSSAGGYKQYNIRSVGNKDNWKTVAWNVDMTPYLEALADPDGWFDISFVTQSGDAVGSVYVDNLRVGIPTTYVASTRSISQTYFTGGEVLDVELTMEAEGDAKEYEIVENIPNEWSVQEISDGGEFADGEITWNLTLGEGTKTVTYKAVAPGEPTESAQFAGTVGGLEVRGQKTVSLLTEFQLNNQVEAPFVANADVTLDGRMTAGEYDQAYVETVTIEGEDDKTPPGVFIDGSTVPTEDSFTINVLHNDEYIYVAIDVVDSELAFNEVSDQAWNNDTVEFFMDGDFSRKTQKDGGPHGFQATSVGNGRLLSGDDAPTVIQEDDTFGYSTDGEYWNYASRVKDDESGWIVEFEIDKSQVLEPADISLIGFDVKIDGSEPGAGTRTSNWGYWFTNAEGVVADGYWDDETGWALLKLEQNQTHVSDWSMF
ncbi:hypothetical protein GF373_05570 [bacterium]|nr:hypothetical protein [bacterium]